MSFTSLLSQISKDKKLQEKAKQLSLSNPTKVSSSLAKSNDASRTKQPPSTKHIIQHRQYPPDDDPAVRRLKEARRKEREKLQAERDLKNKSKPRQSKPRTPSTSSSKATSRTSTSKSSNSTVQRAFPVKKPQNLIPLPPKSRFKNKIFSRDSNTVDNKSDSSSAPKLSFKELMKQAESISKPSSTPLPFTAIKKPTTKEWSKAYQSIQKSRNQSARDSPSALSSRRGPTSPPPRPLSPLLTAFKRPDLPKGPRSRMSQLENLPAKPPTRPSSQLDDDSNRDSYRSNRERPPSFARPNTALLDKLKKKQNNLQSRIPSGPRKKAPSFYNYSSTSRPRGVHDDIDAGDDDDEFDEYGYDDGYGDEYDSQDDGFIVDDEDEEDIGNDPEYQRMRERERQRQMKTQGYSRDEIWDIFNRGKKRDYYDRDAYDSDDMEATGTEILEDEERTLKQAKLDDIREQRLLEKRAAEKRQRLNR